MRGIQRKIVVDEAGKPQEVIISWKDYQEVAEILGLDLDEEAIEDLRQARKDREEGTAEAYLDLEAIR